MINGNPVMKHLSFNINFICNALFLKLSYQQLVFKNNIKNTYYLFF